MPLAIASEPFLASFARGFHMLGPSATIETRKEGRAMAVTTTNTTASKWPEWSHRQRPGLKLRRLILALAVSKIKITVRK